MSKQLIGYACQGAGIVAVALAAFYSPALVRGVLVGGAVAFFVGYFIRKHLA